MRLRFLLLVLLLVTLTACGSSGSEAKLVQSTESADLFFPPTSLPYTKSGGTEQNNSMAHAIGAAATIPPYPTPLPTFLVQSSIVVLTEVPTTIPTNTPTAAPTQALTQSPTSQATSTAQPTATTAATQWVYQYTIQSGSPAYLPNFTNPSAGCAWQGVAGQVFSTSGAPVKNIVVRLTGRWNNTAIDLLGMTGAAAAYGEGGFEIVLGSQALNSVNTVAIQLFDLSGNPLSEKQGISTFADCSKALTMINFKPLTSGYNVPVPIIVKTTAP